MCGCSDVTITGAFSDNSDGSGGQTQSASSSASSFSITWDDCTSGCDCDLDIAGTTSWSWSKSGSTLTVTVDQSITGYESGNSVSMGYTISGYGTYLQNSGSSSRSFTYSCSF